MSFTLQSLRRHVPQRSLALAFWKIGIYAADTVTRLANPGLSLTTPSGYREIRRMQPLRLEER
jgi:predicted transcriptional regulator